MRLSIGDQNQAVWRQGIEVDVFKGSFCCPRLQGSKVEEALLVAPDHPLHGRATQAARAIKK